MPQLTDLQQPRRFPFSTVLSAVLALAALAGCGIPGPPVPPTPKIPQPVQDLTAEQRGGTVLLRFTLPRHLTDGSRLEKLPTMEIFRAVFPDTEDAEALFAGRARPVLVLLPDTIDTFRQGDTLVLPVREDRNLGTELAGEITYYAVRAVNANGRDAGFSNIATLKNLPIPPPPEGFKAGLTEKGVTLEWDPVQAPAAPGVEFGDIRVGYRIFRSRIASPGDFRPIVSVPASNAPITSIVDKKIDWGFQYHYRIRTVVLYGDETVESADSATITIVAEDRFPPPPPERLIASEGPNRVDLSWNASQGKELQGYFIYRSTLPGSDPSANFARITLRPVPSLNYTDSTASPGARYYYVVTAVDIAGNESSRSNEASATAIRFEDQKGTDALLPF